MVSANDILALSAIDALAWFQPHSDDSLFPADFNWLGLAECGVTRARNDEDDSDSLIWALIAITTYDQLAFADQDSLFDVSSMYCRISMIARHGIRENDRILDPSFVFEWFRRRSLPIPRINALLVRLDTEPRNSIVADVLRPLRRLKNHLSVIHELANHCGIPEDIAVYRSYFHRLP